MSNISAVKAAGAEATENAGARLAAGQWRTNSLNVMRAFLGYSSGFSAVIAIMNTGAVLAAVVASEQRYLSVAAVYLATTYTLTVTDQLWEITQVMRNYNRVMGDAHDMVEILDIPPAVADHTDVDFRRGPGRGRVRPRHLHPRRGRRGRPVRGLHPDHRPGREDRAGRATRAAARRR